MGNLALGPFELLTKDGHKIFMQRGELVERVSSECFKNAPTRQPENEVQLNTEVPKVSRQAIEAEKLKAKIGSSRPYSHATSWKLVPMSLSSNKMVPISQNVSLVSTCLSDNGNCGLEAPYSLTEVL